MEEKQYQYINIENQKNRKKHLYILGPLILLIALIGITYAFFNYIRTGSSNVIKVGRISFVSRQTDTINLTNLFPIDPTDSNAMNDNTKVGTLEIEIEGDTDYADGVEYLVSAVNTNNTINGKVLPISLDITVTTLGTESSSYWTARESKNTTIYKKLVDETLEGNGMLLVGYIKPNTTSGTAEGVNGKITIKAYLDKNKISISDTYNGEETDNMETTTNWVNDRVTFTTQEWNSLQQDGVSFKVRVEANQGIWVEEPLTSYTQIIRNVLTPTNPINFANISSSSNGQGLYILPGTENDTNPIYYYRGAVTNNNVIFGDYCWQMVRTTDTGGIKMIYNGAVTGTSEEPTCENTAHADRIISSGAFNSQNGTVADVGYMKNNNADYMNTYAAGATGAVYGKNVEWDGNNYLVIENTANTPSSNTTKDDNHHYSCGTAGTTSCSSVRYYYYGNYYITLTSGELIEDAIYKMTGNIVNPNIDVVTRNAGYVLNNNNSAIKTAIENWFRTNLTNEVDNTKRNYINYVEDTVYCNDRSLKTTGSSNKYEQSGWNPNGGSLSTYLYFGTHNRFKNSWYSASNVPSTACPNESDRFSVGSSVAHLNYPVGLLTADEIIMAGAGGTDNSNNTSYYLYTGGYYWSLSPYYFNDSSAREFRVNNYGVLNGNYVNDYSVGVRPVVSLKHGTEFETGGDGTPTNPYVVKYE